MNFFSNLLKDIGVQPCDYCGEQCLDSCSGFAQDVNFCIGNCTGNCSGTTKEEDAPVICIDCGQACIHTCLHSCGQLTCGDSSCKFYSTSK